MLAIKEEKRLTLGDGIVLQAIPDLDHYYAFNTVSGDQFQLNHTAYWILQAIQDGVDFQNLLTRFTLAFDLNESEGTRDLMEVINFALDNKIIKEGKP